MLILINLYLLHCITRAVYCKTDNVCIWLHSVILDRINYKKLLQFNDHVLKNWHSLEFSI